MMKQAEATQRMFDKYERLFMQALLERPLRRPWLAQDRSEILRLTKECLGVRDEWIPTIRERVVERVQKDGYSVQLLEFESWPGVYGAATLYVPQDETGKKPLTLTLSGHSRTCKFGDTQVLARRIARQGGYALLPDNIGQGERLFMGHGKPVAPFACGLSVQGLIVMETLGWVNWAASRDYIDASQLGAAGNSGGGTLTLFLAALSDKLHAVCSCGYPSTFWWLGAKEKRHCHCNIIPHALPNIEMYELYSLFAPRPLFLAQNTLDNLLPEDLFYKNARNVETTYRMMGCEDQFLAKVLPGTHPWTITSRHEICAFFHRTLGIDPPEDVAEDRVNLFDEDYAFWTPPQRAIDTDTLARRLTGFEAPAGQRLWDVFKPRLEGEPLDGAIARGEVMQILAQFEAFL